MRAGGALKRFILDFFFFSILTCLSDVLKYNEAINCRRVPDCMQSMEERERESEGGADLISIQS